MRNLIAKKIRSMLPKQELKSPKQYLKCDKTGARILAPSAHLAYKTMKKVIKNLKKS